MGLLVFMASETMCLRPVHIFMRWKMLGIDASRNRRGVSPSNVLCAGDGIGKREAEKAMGNTFVERQVENAVQEMLDDKAVRVLKGVRRIAAKQGGGSVIENYQLLGKRTLIAVGVVVVAVQAVTTAVGFVVSRKTEEQRIERIVRRVLEEERQKAEA